MIKILVDGVEFEQGEVVEGGQHDNDWSVKGELERIHFGKNVYHPFVINRTWCNKIRKLPQTRELTHAEIFKHVFGKCVFKQGVRGICRSNWVRLGLIEYYKACIIDDLDTEREVWHELNTELLVKLGVAL